MLRSEGVEGIVGSGRVQSGVEIEAHAIGNIEQRSDIPLVLCIQTKESELHGRGPLGVTAGQFRISVLICELVRSISEEGLEVIVVPRTVCTLDEEVLHLVELIVCTKSDVVVAFVPREVVFDRPNILIEVVGGTAEICTDVNSIHRGTVTTGDTFDIYVRTLVSDIAVIANEACRDTGFVIEYRADMRVQLSYERVGLVVYAIAGVVERISTAAQSVLVIVRVVVLVAESQMVVHVDVPVQTGQ